MRPCKIDSFVNLVDGTAYAQQCQHNQLSLEEMGNILLDAMQGTLICLDSHHIIMHVSKSIKRYFGFEQVRTPKDFSFIEIDYFCLGGYHRSFDTTTH